MQLAEKIVLGGLAVVAAVGGGVLIGKAMAAKTSTSVAPSAAPSAAPGAAPGGTAAPSAAPGAAPGGTAAQTNLAWVSTTTLNPGDNVRITVAPSDLQTLATSLGLTGTAMAIWSSVLANPTVQASLSAQNILAWTPGQSLPADWPTSDAHAADGYHAQFTYNGTQPLAVSNSPVPFAAWVAKGMGA
jgi:hypothetical protein